MNAPTPCSIRPNRAVKLGDVVEVHGHGYGDVSAVGDVVAMDAARFTVKLGGVLLHYSRAHWRLVGWRGILTRMDRVRFCRPAGWRVN